MELATFLKFNRIYQKFETSGLFLLLKLEFKMYSSSAIAITTLYKCEMLKNECNSREKDQTKCYFHELLLVYFI